MATLAIRGNNERAEDIARLFKDLGAQGEYSPCSDESYLYYIAHDKKVVYIIDQPDNIYRNLLFNVYTIEEFEAKFPYRVGDKVAYDEYYSTNEPPVEQVAHIKYMSWSCNHSDVCYTMENGTKRGVAEIWKVEPKFVPKDGDVVTYMNRDKATIYVFAGGRKYNTSFYVAYSGLRNKVFKASKGHLDMNRDDIRPATEEEKKKLFDKLAEEGLEWNAEERKLVKLKWKPEEGKRFWFPIYGSATIRFEPMLSLFNKGRDKVFLEKGWCFKIEEECQDFCDLLNDAINQVEP
jgi:hypothetical protein